MKAELESERSTLQEEKAGLQLDLQQEISEREEVDWERDSVVDCTDIM